MGYSDCGSAYVLIDAKTGRQSSEMREEKLYENGRDLLKIASGSTGGRKERSTNATFSSFYSFTHLQVRNALS